MPLPTKEEATYLGDGLYSRYDGFQFEVFSHNGVRASDSVFFERGTFRHFMALGKIQWPDLFEERK